MGKIIAVDFDGTLCKNLYPKIGKKIQKTFDYLLQDETNQLILWTCRTGDELSQAVEWCKDNGLEFDAVNENLPDVIDKFGNDCRKVYADIYLDDKSLNVVDVKEERCNKLITKDREYRAFEIRAKQGEEDSKKCRVEGYAATFNQPTVMYEYDGIQFKEEIDRSAFRGAQMQDVVMNFNHSGKPVARTKNSTLELFIDDIGLRVVAELGGTEEGRKLYEEIQGGYIDKMSFAFTVSSEEYNKDTRTRRITGIKRLFDVAAVDIPAYDSTSISARSYFLAEAEREKAEALELKTRRHKLKIKLMMEE